MGRVVLWAVSKGLSKEEAEQLIDELEDLCRQREARKSEATAHVHA